MPSIKYQYSERLLALHEEWAVKNGYRDKPQAASAKLQAASERRSDGTKTSKLLQKIKTTAQS
jgi:hypothetical protein|tara:strand:+ start:327 stop:515 length:189 start_codon:yes stop_codon:yes gene_type:complete